MPNKEVEAP